MRSDPLDVAMAVQIGRGTVRKMRQNLDWAIGYNSLALPIAAGVFEPFGFTLRPEIGAISMFGSSVLVAVNALALNRLHLPRPAADVSEPPISFPRAARLRFDLWQALAGARLLHRDGEAVALEDGAVAADESPLDVELDAVYERCAPCDLEVKRAGASI